MDEKFFSLRFTWKWYHSIRLVKANLACYSMVDFEKKNFFVPSRVWVLIVVPKNRKIQIGLKMTACSRRVRWWPWFCCTRSVRRENGQNVGRKSTFSLLGTTDHGETCTNGQKKFFSWNQPYYSTLDSPRRDESNGTTFRWIREKNFFRPFSRVWVLIVVPKSENVDFRPTFCLFSRLTDLVQQNQDYHRTRREKAVNISSTCIFRFFGTTISTQTRENGRKKFFSRNRPYYSTLDSPWRDESNGTTFKWIWEKNFWSLPTTGKHARMDEKKFFSPIHLKVVPFDSSRHGESSVL